MSVLIPNTTSIAPTAVGDLVLNLDASMLSGADSSAVSSWAGVEGTYTAAQATGTKQPLLKTTAGPNGGKCVLFDGTDDCLTIPSFVSSSHLSVFVVYKKTTASAALMGMIIEQSASAGAGTPGFYLYEPGNAGGIVAYGGVATVTTGVACWASVGDWAIASMICNGTPSIYQNGVQMGIPFYASATTVPKGNTTATLNIGARNNGASLPIAGSIAQILVFNRSIGSRTHMGVVEWLKQKHNLAF